MRCFLLGACILAFAAPLTTLSQSRPATSLAQPATKPWLTMDRGPCFSASVESSLPQRQMTPKGLIIRVGTPVHPAYVLFDEDLLRYSAAWTGPQIIDWRSVVFDGSHRTWPSVVGDEVFGTLMIPGWAKDGSFADPRTRYPSTDYDPQPPHWQNRGYGPLPHDWARYKGLYLNGQRVVLSYTVGGTGVLDSPGWREAPRLGDGVFTRTLNIEKSSADLVLEVLEHPTGGGGVTSLDGRAPLAATGAALDSLVILGRPVAKPAKNDHALAIASIGAIGAMAWEVRDSHGLRLHVPAAATPARVQLLIARVTDTNLPDFSTAVRCAAAPDDLWKFTHGGPPRWSQKLTTRGVRGDDARAAYAIDHLTAPIDNPWKSLMRFGGFDFFPDGRRAALCTWDGDVWIVDGLGEPSLDRLTWQRIATGLFQPLGVKIISDAAGHDQIFICCRDQIVRLHDLNGDGETDFYECFNNDHQVTEHFHEFAMGLQTDREGNFYYAKAARHALPAVVPQHGTLLKVSRDGSRTEIIAGGFRAANGVGLGEDGSIVVSDQEGYWTPANRINVLKPDGFYGNMWSYAGRSRATGDGFDPPLCWLPVKVDRSPAEELWVSSDRWGPLKGAMLHTSYGTGKLFLVLPETVDGIPQGGVVPMPGLAFETGIMRARFNPRDGQLYVCGLTGWATNCVNPSGFYRVRYTGKPVCLPSALHVRPDGIALTFTARLDKEAAEDVDSYAVRQWQYRWSERYGSPHYSVADSQKQGEDDVKVDGAELSADGRTVLLRIKEIKPVMQMQVQVNVKSAAGEPLKFTLHNTINQVAK
jgi:hypothetical protein